MGFKYFVLYVFVLFSSPSEISAQIGPIIGGYEKNTKGEIKKIEVEENIQFKNLAFQITKNCKTDSEKAKAIYKWLGTNLDYDYELLKSKALQKQIYISEKNVMRQSLKRKKALCSGYAYLFQELCSHVGINAKVIYGTTKTNKNKAVSSTPDHSWNMVKLNGKWELLDITWARSHGSGNNLDDYWYCTDPEYFNRTHFSI